jgi:hypothetical protein
MTRERLMALFAPVVDATASHLDGNDVELRVVVDAAGLRV